LLHLASTPGCTSNIATIVNGSRQTVNVTLKMKDVVVWRGQIDWGETARIPYRVVSEGHVVVSAELSQGTIKAGGGYVTPLVASTELFVIEPDRISLIQEKTDFWRYWQMATILPACAIQSVLDLTGAPDPNEFK